MVDTSDINIHFNQKAMKTELAKWLTDNLDNFESEQDGVDEMNYWINNNVGRFMEVVVG